MKKITKEAAWNFVAAVEYLKEFLETIDVSEDFADDQYETITAWDLITNNEVYDAIEDAAGLQGEE